MTKDNVDPRMLQVAEIIEDSIVFVDDEDEINFMVALTGYFADRAAMVRFMGDFGSDDGAS